MNLNYQADFNSTDFCGEHTMWSLQLGDYEDKRVLLNQGLVGGVTQLTLNEWYVHYGNSL